MQSKLASCRLRMSSRTLSRTLTVALLALTGLAVAGPPASPAAVSVGHSGWFWGSPLPQGNPLTAIDFFGNRGYAVGGFGTLLRTDDGGTTWSGLPSGTTTALTDLRVLDADTLITGGVCALRRSNDGGRTFTRLPFSASEDRCPSILESFDFVSAAAGFVVLHDGTVVQTPDGGESFAQRTAVPGTEATGSGTATPTDIVFTSPTTGIATTTGAGGTEGRIYRTTDSAGSWTLVASAPRGFSGMVFPTPDVGYAVGTANTFFETTNGGVDWIAKPLEGAPAGNQFRAIACAGTETCLISTDAGDRLIRTTDGGDTGTSVSPSTRQVFAAGFASDTRAVAVGDGGTTVTSDTGGATFDPIGGRLTGAFGRLRAVSATTAYASGRDGRVARTQDGGRSWTAIGVSTADDVVDVSFPTPSVGFVLDSSGTALRTANGGATFRILNTGTTSEPNAILALDGDRVLLVGPRGIRRSTDAGEQFNAVRSKALSKALLSDVDRAGAAIFAYGRRALVVSTNGGQAFRTVRLPRGSVREIDFISARVGFLLQTSGRFYATRNGGRTWTESLSVGSNRGVNIAFGDAQHGFIDAAVPTPSGIGVLQTSDGGRSWQPQLIAPTSGQTDIAAFGARTGFALVSGEDTQLFATVSAGQAGTVSRLSLKASSARVRPGRTVRVSGRLSAAQGGEFVIVARRSATGWERKNVRVASNGAFTSSWRMRRSADFVAQWRGDDARRGDGTAALRVGVDAPKRRRGRK